MYPLKHLFYKIKYMNMKYLSVTQPDLPNLAITYFVFIGKAALLNVNKRVTIITEYLMSN